MSDLLTTFLAKERQNRCSVCANEAVAEIIEQHLDLLYHNKTTITLNAVYDGLLFPQFGHPKTMDTVRNHVRKCLNRDPATGAEL